MFAIDGVEYNVKCSIEREIEIKESSISGMLLNGQVFRDILGTYYSYEVRLEMPLKNKGRYHTLIEQLSEPVDGHVFTLPYNTDEIQLTGKVDKPRDVWVKLPSGYTYWDGLEFTILPNGPTKSLSLQQVISRGLTPLPDAQSPNVGDTYTFTVNGWESTGEMPDADSIAY